jgi:anti-anti-sigma factor
VGRSEFGVDRSTDGDAGWLRVRGDIDLASATAFGHQLKAAITESPVVNVDLSEVGFLDSTGVRALVEAYRLATRLQRHLYVVGAHDWVERVLTMTGVGPLLAPPDRP